MLPHPSNQNTGQQQPPGSDNHHGLFHRTTVLGVRPCSLATVVAAVALADPWPPLYSPLTGLPVLLLLCACRLSVALLVLYALPTCPGYQLPAANISREEGGKSVTSGPLAL
eukprot:3933761-Rhodomonas_salina.1